MGENPNVLYRTILQFACKDLPEWAQYSVRIKSQGTGHLTKERPEKVQKALHTRIDHFCKSTLCGSAKFQELPRLFGEFRLDIKHLKR